MLKTPFGNPNVSQTKKANTTEWQWLTETVERVGVSGRQGLLKNSNLLFFDL